MNVCGINGRWTERFLSQHGPLGGAGRSALPEVVAESTQSWCPQRG